MQTQPTVYLFPPQELQSGPSVVISLTMLHNDESYPIYQNLIMHCIQFNVPSTGHVQITGQSDWIEMKKVGEYLSRAMFPKSLFF